MGGGVGGQEKGWREMGEAGDGEMGRETVEKGEGEGTK